VPQEANGPEELEKRVVESLMSDPGLRDELTDDEARPLMDWGLSQAAAIARRMAAQASAESLDDAVGDLRKLMKRINRLVGHRREGDPELVRKDLRRLAKYSERLFGGTVVRPDEAQLETFLAEQAVLDNRGIVERLLAMFTPPQDAAPSLETSPEPQRLTAPPPPEQLHAPPQPEKLDAPPQPHQLAGPESPELLSDQGENEPHEPA